MSSPLIKAYLDDVANLDLSNDPLAWVMYCFEWGSGELAGFPDGPDEWQREEMVKIKEKLGTGESLEGVIQQAVASGNGVGKSAFVSWLILWAMTTYEDTKGIVTANTETQLRTKTWAELAKWHRLCLVKEMLVLSATAIYSSDPEHEKTWRVDMIPWSDQNPESFAGMHNKGKRIIIIFDEASAISDVIWEVTEGALTDENTQIMWFAFGNYTRNKGKFHDCFTVNSHRWGLKQLDSRTCKMTNKKQIQQWIDDYGEDSDFVKIHVRGMAPSSDSTQLFSTKDIDAAYGKVLRKEQFDFAPVIITCDPAWTGRDKLIIAKRQGLSFCVLREIPKNDNDVLIASILAQIEDEEQADAVILDAGYGTGIISAGKTMGRRWHLVWNASTDVPDASCHNVRAWTYKQVREWLKQGGAIPADPELKAELQSIEIKDNLSGKLLLKAKTDMKKSPNKADTLALSFAIPIREKRGGRGGMVNSMYHKVRVVNRFNPLRR